MLGALVALALSSSLSAEALESWGWRLPFVFGMLVIPVGIYIRRHLEETAAETPDGGEAKSSLHIIFKDYRRTVVSGVLLVIGSTASSYIVLDYMTNYTVTVLHLPMTMGTTAACIGALVQTSLSIWAGRLSDRIGRRRTIA
jgi:MFS family permease